MVDLQVGLLDYRRQNIVLFKVLEEEIYTKIPEEMAEVLEEYYTYKDILTLIKYIYGIFK